ncbi:hypothetical protein A3A63_02445 [Candidatus Gottesmanbacteria bacterium RIFCSPLOWO2_01_FULL_46_9]|uniref:Uncharacterized protein n=1 Tax=Candidatus Gottesmanbacteria bacterium RIFCSPLOWO2_01_FULL_46_9 TaxID=1798394 RepID=A0A1F6AZQ6_9BACT|nr:MAG: hypothetical protein A3A63_02445 [Candidatus Gottesmanbacteria bacterium RIFCSPLOWO2_01_FULL_46_9]
MKIIALDLGQIGGDKGLGPFGNIGQNSDTTAGLTGITNIISSVVGFMTIAAGVWFLFQLLFAGYEWMTAGGDTKRIGGSRDRIVHAFIGLVIVIAAWSLLAVVGQFFGYNILIDPGDVIKQLTIPRQ